MKITIKNNENNNSGNEDNKSQKKTNQSPISSSLITKKSKIQKNYNRNISNNNISLITKKTIISKIIKNPTTITIKILTSIYWWADW